MKVINVQVPEELHKLMRIAAVKEGKSVKQFITDMLEKELRKEKESIE